MALPSNNANLFYRMRKDTSTTTHQGLYYYNSAFAYGGLDGSSNELWQLSNNKLKNAQTGTYIGGSGTTPALVAASSAPTVTFETGSNSDTYYVKASTGKYLNWTSANKLEWGSSKSTAWRFEIFSVFRSWVSHIQSPVTTSITSQLTSSVSLILSGPSKGRSMGSSKNIRAPEISISMYVSTSLPADLQIIQPILHNYPAYFNNYAILFVIPRNLIPRLGIKRGAIPAANWKQGIIIAAATQSI